ncbi:MAG: response regulator transcription factor [Acidobacteriaceae bacterium]|nr:response regulator transcription factor [Acidobacteriaceae bacterium]
MIRVLIASPSPVARAGVEALLRTSPNIEIVTDEPDVVIADADRRELLDLPPHTALVVLSNDTPAALTAEALRSGVRGVVPRDATPNQVIAAIEAAAAGLVVLPLEDVETVLAAPRPAPTSEALSPRETEVLGMMAEGLSNKEIAYRLGISEHTVKFHATSILTKLNAGSRTEAVMLGLRQGLILL